MDREYNRNLDFIVIFLSHLKIVISSYKMHMCWFDMSNQIEREIELEILPVLDSRPFSAYRAEKRPVRRNTR